MMLHMLYWFAPLDSLSTLLCTDLYIHTSVSSIDSGFHLGLANEEDRQETAGMAENKIGMLISMTFSLRGFCRLAGWLFSSPENHSSYGQVALFKWHLLSLYFQVTTPSLCGCRYQGVNNLNRPGFGISLVDSLHTT